ncbi:tRNA-dihydrouridine(16/17) synthase [NAD(P)(+)] [Yarrowia sp. C11]|nr:tRNA-dihydrouridine(16/17) synthase [NAD(P)(+)] [Yarrowia sp. E02]KAG5372447.1 tRNA-dihydrouridine(16/17) synthase [NAD(P)(+)] [Yarrowia sp. C11]
MTAAAAASDAPETTKLAGRQLFEKMGKPKTIVAPMVDQSELAWRILSRRHGAELCYTPMFHAKLFGTSDRYREEMFGPMDGDEKTDRPLVVQFCANDPDELLAAAKLVEDKCDAVDLNLGCPQGIARKGHYGSFLMEDWDLIHKLINKLHLELKVPVTAKMRVFSDREKTLEYAKMIINAGAQFLTIHGRTREMKGQQTGLADWEIIKYVRENLPKDTVVFANGNVLYSEDVEKCMEETTTDAVMSAEGNLYNPAIFNKPADKDVNFPRVDKMLREYFEIVKETPGKASNTAMKSHFFKILHAFLPVETELRAEIGKTSKAGFDVWEKIVQKVEEKVAKIYEDPNVNDEVVIGEEEAWGGAYRTVPYWRCQPYFRRCNGEKANVMVSRQQKEAVEAKKREAESGDEDKEDKESDAKKAKLE